MSLTATVTLSSSVILMLDVDGVTATFGVTLATVTDVETPDAVVYVGELDESGV